MKLSSTVVGDSNNENNFPHKLLSTNTHVWKLCNAVANCSSANIKLAKTQLHKIEQSGGFLGRQLGPILKTGLPLMKNVLNTLANFFFDSIRITAAASAADAAIHKKIFESTIKILITSNEEMNDIMKIVKSLEESGLFIQLKMK